MDATAAKEAVSAAAAAPKKAVRATAVASPSPGTKHKQTAAPLPPVPPPLKTTTAPTPQQQPPSIITLQDEEKKDDNDAASSSADHQQQYRITSTTQRTPKHANKSELVSAATGGAAASAIAAPRGNNGNGGRSAFDEPPPRYYANNYPPPRYEYVSRFEPEAGARYYGGGGGGPPPPPPPYYDMGGAGGRPPMYHAGPPPPHPHPHAHAPPAGYHHHHMMHHPHYDDLPYHRNEHFSRAVSSSFDRGHESGGGGTTTMMMAAHGGGGGNNEAGRQSLPLPPPPLSSSLHGNLELQESISDDASWKQLNQVTSVDEEELRKRVERKKHHDGPHHHSPHATAVAHAAAAATTTLTTTQQQQQQQPPPPPPSSNHSSLTNSPTEGVVKKDDHDDVAAVAAATAVLPRSSKHSSLESLSSVASAQEPLKKALRVAVNNTPDSHSLDLMKCPSGSSALLLGGRLLQASHTMDDDDDDDVFHKRGRHDDEDRDDSVVGAGGHGTTTTTAVDDDDARQDGHRGSSSSSSTHPPANKKLKPSSPLSITCSPTTGNSNNKTKPKAVYAKKKEQPGASSADSFYDKPPAYSYSVDSVVLQHHALAPPVTARPHSSASSTITPMHVEDAKEQRQLQQQNSNMHVMPSWDIGQQNSFGNDSVTHHHPHPSGATTLMSSFSFTNDYPVLQSTDSQDRGMTAQLPPPPPPQQQQLMPPAGGGPPMSLSDMRSGGPARPLESRNPSFDYATHPSSGGPPLPSRPFDRNDSMMSYDSHHSYHEARQGYPSSFPPHAPSWGSGHSGSGGGSSYHHHHHHHGAPHPPPHPHYYRNYPGPGMMMMRNYSEDNNSTTGRNSPRMLPPSFQPPPDFRVGKASGMQHQYVNVGPSTGVSTSGAGPGVLGGPFGWTKEEDALLTELLKKQKNPRDWDPIAKELGRGKTAKECHERWIRYLKPGVRKGQWTDAEDAIVMEAVTTSSEQPFTRWSDLAQRLPGRVGKQIRDRWVNHLNPHINHLPFSRDDDLRLWEGHQQLGKRWVEISSKCFDSGRSENHIKNRWYSASFKKFIANEFGSDAYNGSNRETTSTIKSNADDTDMKSKTIAPPKKVKATQEEAV